MKKSVVKRLNAELMDYEKQLIIQQLDTAQMLDEAYQIVMKRELVEVMERLAEENRLVEYLWEFLNKQEEVLEYLYQLWMECDYSFVSELAELMGNEMEYQLRVS